MNSSIRINQTTIKQIERKIVNRKLTEKNKKKIIILDKWTNGNIIPIDLIKINKSKEINKKHKCKKCNLNALYELDKNYYCWTHNYLETLINI